jgi:hypothetical protein
MKLYFFRGHSPNFGDELNEWMWPRLLPGMFDDDDREIFIGTGSSIFDFHSRQARKIVVGAGYAGYTALPQIDSTWDFRFVRGRLTAEAVGISPSLGVGDSGILIRSFGLQHKPQRTDTIFIPHWSSSELGHWKRVCEEAGVSYVDPRDDVDAVLDRILSARLVITEAMHGAIVSDALRVPWLPITPIEEEHRWKWLDWASALDLKLQMEKLPNSTLFEHVSRSRLLSKKWRGRFRRHAKPVRHVTDYFVNPAAVKALKDYKGREGFLSSDQAISRAHEAMLEHVAKLKAEHAVG